MTDWKSVFKNKLLWIAAFGYFVDLYDLVLYGVVRVASLRTLGVPEDQFFSVGTSLLNAQMGGMLVGGLAWGILGDQRGRKTALFGSIFIYSIANILNAFVQTIPQYAALRFLAGFGLAGELGAAITLISETLPLQARGIGAALVASVGFLGAALSSSIAQNLPWQHAYFSGGVLGFVLLFARMSVSESAVYLKAKVKISVSFWKSLKTLFITKDSLKRFLFCLLAGIPIWYVAGILSYFSPEFAKAYHVQGEVTAGYTIMVGYLGSIVGDIACGLVSQKIKSRKRAVLYFLFFGGALAIGHHFLVNEVSANLFYFIRFTIGFGCGYVALLVVWISELFGTNLRATTTTLLPNLIRASVIPLTLSMKALMPNFGIVNTSIFLGTISFAVAILAALQLEDTFYKEIDFLEP